MAKKNKTEKTAEAETVTNGKASEKTKKRGKKSPSVAAPEKEAPEGTPAGAQSSEKYKYVIKNRAVRKHGRKRVLTIVLLIFIASTIVFGALVYGISLMIQHNNLKILVDRSGTNVFSLSSSAQFEVGTEVLALGGPRYMDNTTLMDFYGKIPEIQATEGAYHPKDVKFLAATFYLKNVTNKTQTYTEAVELSEVTQNLDSAMRVMLIKGDTQTVYAKAKPGESGGSYAEDAAPEEVVPGRMYGEGGAFVDSDDKAWIATPFLNPRYAFYNTGNGIEPGEVVRYTVIVWLEGFDEDCVDARLGGTVRVELQFIQS